MLEIAYQKRDITPRQDEPLIGYMNRTGLSEGVLNPIFVKVLIIKIQSKLVVWISFETLAITREFTSKTREKLKQNFNFDYVTLSATHTHFAPALNAHTWFQGASKGYEEYVYEQLRDALIEAMNSFKKVRIGFKKCYYDEVGNSRIARQVVDHHTYLSLLQFRTLNDEPVLSMISYNCHPTVLGQEFNQVSGDYISDLTNHFESEAHDCIFFQGAAGDISTRYTRSSKDNRVQKKHFGDLLAKKVLLMQQQLIFEEVETFKWSTKEMGIKHKSIEASVIREELDILEQQYKESSDRFLETKIQGCKVLLKMEQYLDQVEKSIEIDVFELNDLFIAFVAGEPYSSLDFIENGFVVGYSNGYPGYIYDQHTIESYESISSLMEAGTLDQLKRYLKQMMDELRKTTG